MQAWIRVRYAGRPLGWTDGPLTLDLAIGRQAVQDKQIQSRVAGVADILLTPDIHSGNMIAKQLTRAG